MVKLSDSLHAFKALGQHFILNQDINFAIASKAGDLAGINIIEIGSGPGGLTEAILKSGPKSVTALEKDRRFVDYLRPLEGLYNNLIVLPEDALSFNYCQIDSPKIIIANLPYNISSQLIFKWLEELKNYRALYLMLQREVVDRICAAPGTKSYGKLSVLVQYQAKAGRVMDLSPGSFSPPPKVNSALVEIIPNSVDCIPFFIMEKLCRVAFMHRRKMVIKALRTLFGDPSPIMNGAGIPQNARAENISVSQFVSIARFLSAPSV
ncbi:MAG: 16S rRNA (adenine(1518)-N(6)/adenine(1519)-N(6))-dimethyltransferase RsmA [Holosporales bacterium]|nr:16S rRNA (adenine(1518)-N(6)/adenine(1519)-N(6))-dimethyltransferase RsmA [Holosporales bacterium]